MILPNSVILLVRDRLGLKLSDAIFYSMSVRINLRNYLFDGFSFPLRGSRKVDNDRLTDQRNDHVHLANRVVDAKSRARPFPRSWQSVHILFQFFKVCKNLKRFAVVFSQFSCPNHQISMGSFVVLIFYVLFTRRAGMISPCFAVITTNFAVFLSRRCRLCSELKPQPVRVAQVSSSRRTTSCSRWSGRRRSRRRRRAPPRRSRSASTRCPAASAPSASAAPPRRTSPPPPSSTSSRPSPSGASRTLEVRHAPRALSFSFRRLRLRLVAA